MAKKPGSPPRPPVPPAAPAADDIGDTTRLIYGRDDSLIAGTGGSSEILDVIVEALERSPERADLWMMRFEIMATFGMKADFAATVRTAQANPGISRRLQWPVVRKIWDGLAPGEPMPEMPAAGGEDTTPSAAAVAAPEAVFADSSASEQPHRRFSDIAVEVAGPELEQLMRDYDTLRTQPGFFTDYARNTRLLLKRPTPMHHAESLSRAFGGTARVFLKREDMHKDTPELQIAVGQSFIARAFGKQVVITGNDVDDYSLTLASIAPQFGLKATIVIRPADAENKGAMIARLRELGAQVETMRSDGLKSSDPREAALRLWQTTSSNSHLALSYGIGPAPYPRMVSDFQMLLGYESDLQLRAQSGPDRPRTLIASVHSEADSIGFMLMYVKRPKVELYYVEPEAASGRVWQPSVRLRAYNGAIREHAWLRASGRITHTAIPDAKAQTARDQVKALEDIDISLEDARAVALAAQLARRDDRDIAILVA